MKSTVVGLFPDLRHAQDAIDNLVADGFPRDAISIMANEAAGADKIVVHEEQGSSAASGAGTGAAVGGVAGLFLGLVSLAVPGVGPVVAAGPIVAALGGVLLGAAAGGLIGAMVDLGVPEEHAHFYAEGIRRGGTVVTVQTDDHRAQQAVEVMQIHGVLDIHSHVAEWRRQGWTGYDPNASALPPDQQDVRRAA